MAFQSLSGSVYGFQLKSALSLGLMLRYVISSLHSYLSREPGPGRRPGHLHLLVQMVIAGGQGLAVGAGAGGYCDRSHNAQMGRAMRRIRAAVRPFEFLGDPRPRFIRRPARHRRGQSPCSGRAVNVRSRSGAWPMLRRSPGLHSLALALYIPSYANQHHLSVRAIAQAASRADRRGSG
jgi:hypothetical protein